MSEQKRTAVVTGGASGIGQEIVRHLAQQGLRVVSVDWNETANRQTADEVCAAGGECLAAQGDVSVSADVNRAFAIAGDVDVLVNNAAFSQGDGFLLEITEEALDRTIGVCLKGVLLCSQAALRSMTRNCRGCIINISSVNAMTGIHLAAYTAAKGGVISLTRALAAQYGGFGIRVNTISPGTILSESSRKHYEMNPEVNADLLALYPNGRFGSTQDIAAAVSFLISDDASFINGANIPIDGGLTAVRRLPSLRHGS